MKETKSKNKKSIS